LTAVPVPVITGLLGQVGAPERSLPGAALTGGPDVPLFVGPEVHG
jgi:hypothetical protein